MNQRLVDLSRQAGMAEVVTGVLRDRSQGARFASREVEHMKHIVSMQKRYGKVSGFQEVVSVVSLVKDSLRLNTGALTRHEVDVVREFDGDPLRCHGTG